MGLSVNLLVINNLSSGYGEGAIYDFIRAFVSNGDEVVLRSTDGTSDLRLFLHDAEEYDMVVVAGGDGTISSVIYQLADTGIPVLPFPAGTANLLTTNLASPSEPHALADMAREGTTMDFDVGEIEYADGTKAGFVIMAGAGYDATIMRGAEPGKRLLGPLSYFTSALANATPQHAEFTLTIDGNTVHSAGVGVLIVNFSKIQFDLSVVHENKPRDGEFDVVVLHSKHAFGLTPALISCILDRSGEFPARSDAFEIYRGRDIVVEAEPALLAQYDGEVTSETTPFSVRILPGAARIVVSEEGRKLFSAPR